MELYREIQQLLSPIIIITASKVTATSSFCSSVSNMAIQMMVMFSCYHFLQNIGPTLLLPEIAHQAFTFIHTFLKLANING